MTYLCGGNALPDLNWPDAGQGMCCARAWDTDGHGCTCWEPIYDTPTRATPDPTTPPATRPTMCPDCAYRPNSPERRGEEHVSGDTYELDQAVTTGRVFSCHQGIPRVTAYRHPTGAVFTPPADITAAAYEPRIRDGIPYKADGTPADVCAGWAARRAKHLARTATGEQEPTDG